MIDDLAEGFARVGSHDPCRLLVGDPRSRPASVHWAFVVSIQVRFIAILPAACACPSPFTTTSTGLVLARARPRPALVALRSAEQDRKGGAGMRSK
jgi:hypothetical protein